MSDHTETAIKNIEAALSDAEALAVKLAQCLADAAARVAVLRGTITPNSGGGVPPPKV
jgi:hypothetical protein